MAASAFDGSAQPILGDRYQPLQSLGKKAGRQTWLAEDLQTQKQVVVKLLTFGSEFSWDDLKLFEREAQTLQSLSHPAIPRYLDYFELDATRNGFALVQTYIPARSLEQQLRAGRSFTEAEVRRLARDLLKILAYLHDRQPPVIHRDLKPSNILLTDRSETSPSQVYLVDFGSVQTVTREGGTMTVVGTYGYMPPEQFGGRAMPASDLYSLGATLIYLATGRHPADLPQTDLRIDFESIAQLSPGLTRWLKWMTEPSPSKRPKSAQEALDELKPKGKPTATIAQVPRTKPRYSRIELIRDRQFLEVVMPTEKLILPRKWSWWAVIVLFIVPYVLFFWALYAVPMFLLSRLFGKTRIIINQQHLLITYELFGWRYRQSLMVPRRHIWQLELLAYGAIPRILLWAGTQQCEFRGSRAELEWLASELSDWLALPLSHENP